jgi:Ran GTPase-activating protein (RanGAP) involved in mRNA processing and transport
VHVLDLVNAAPGEPALLDVIAAVAEQPNAIECLYLGGNALDAEVAPALADLVSANQNLRGLFLNVNRFGDSGARLLADGLSRNRGLRALGLASNGFGPEGVAAMARALCGHPELNALDFGFSPSTRVLGCAANRVCGEAVPALADLIAGSPQLAELNLDRTGIDRRDLELLARAAERNPAVMKVSYTGPRAAALDDLFAARRLPAGWRPPVRLDVSLIRSVYR